MSFRKTLKSIGIIPVIQINDAEKAVPLALALKKGGLPAAEAFFFKLQLMRKSKQQINIT